MKFDKNKLVIEEQIPIADLGVDKEFRVYFEKHPQIRSQKMQDDPTIAYLVFAKYSNMTYSTFHDHFVCLPVGKKIFLCEQCSGEPFSLLSGRYLFDCVSKKLVCVSLLQERSGESITKLSDGRILIVGGQIKDKSTGHLLRTNTTEIFDPVSGKIASGPLLQVGRADHRAVLMPDGRVLVCGGDATSPNFIERWGMYDLVYLDSVEICDVEKNVSKIVGKMLAARTEHTVMALNNEQVLISGGKKSGKLDTFQTNEIFDLSQGQSSETISLATPRQNHCLVCDQQNKLLVVGGEAYVDEDSQPIYRYTIEQADIKQVEKKP
ncbi:MAG: hypothetical protein K2W82_12700 [Candidatus Obscuribacterales bacterium]|nr:hypothetical protein [Candidatus Obscuribacterales bacterium]